MWVGWEWAGSTLGQGLGGSGSLLLSTFLLSAGIQGPSRETDRVLHVTQRGPQPDEAGPPAGPHINEPPRALAPREVQGAVDTELRTSRGMGPQVPGLCGTLSLPGWAGKASWTPRSPSASPACTVLIQSNTS